MSGRFSRVAAGDDVAWVRAMWNHAERMIGPITERLGEWPEFQSEEMNHLIAYVGAAGTTGKLNGESVLRGSAERGWKVFQSKCLGCHAVSGQGGKIGPELGPRPGSAAHHRTLRSCSVEPCAGDGGARAPGLHGNADPGRRRDQGCADLSHQPAVF